MSDPSSAKSNASLGLKLGGVAVFMVFMAPVLYWSGSIVCNWAGLGFNPDAKEMAAEGESKGLKIECSFTAMMSEEFDGKVEFTVTESSQTIVVGDARAGKNLYQVKNISNQALYIRPIHFVSPPQASLKFRMTECFCYNDMKLEPGEARDLPLVYGFKADMDSRVTKALINYTLEPITEDDLRPTIGPPNKGPFEATKPAVSPLDGQP
ncbi:MAG: cytochrome c oxidase assembly protein [Planctomycetota bacterium]|jgi:cytochrome c oxidase assembly protein subunit 11|nr:cytochrome c oxidase assembly protein [Planctomycetota bacterium]